VAKLPGGDKPPLPFSQAATGGLEFPRHALAHAGPELQQPPACLGSRRPVTRHEAEVLDLSNGCFRSGEVVLQQRNPSGRIILCLAQVDNLSQSQVSPGRDPFPPTVDLCK